MGSVGFALLARLRNMSVALILGVGFSVSMSRSNHIARMQAKLAKAVGVMYMQKYYLRSI